MQAAACRWKPILFEIIGFSLEVIFHIRNIQNLNPQLVMLDSFRTQEQDFNFLENHSSIYSHTLVVMTLNAVKLIYD